MASAPLPPPGCLLACPHNPPAGATVSLHKLCPVPCCQGCPGSWADVSLADTGVAECSWNKVQQGHRAGTEGTWPGQPGHPAPVPPKAGLWRWRICRASLGTLGGGAVCASCPWQATFWCGYVSSASNLGSSRSYKLHSSLRPGAGLPCPRVIRDRPDCTSVAAHRKAENPVSCRV